MNAIKILREGLLQAVHQLWANKLRSMLSLLGIAIGIFCIISVLSAVNSLEEDIRGSFKRLGDDVLYIDKMPWDEDPEENYWKYLKRPSPKYSDYQFLQSNLESAKYISMYFIMGIHGIKYQSNQVDGVPILAVTNDMPALYNVEFEKGRWYSPYEYSRGTDQIVLGHDVAENLFGPVDPIGKIVKYKGRKLSVVGVTKKVGNSLINPMNFDILAMVSFHLGKEIVKLDGDNLRFGSSLQIKAKEDVSLETLKDEVTVSLRRQRRLKPIASDNFAINTLSIITKVFDAVFGVMSWIGWIIGSFSILVGCFSVANIMFVSVKERTNIIGIKKALGARKIVILYEFLVEAVILCIIGGLLGLLLVFIVMKVLSMGSGFQLYLNTSNVVLGIGVSLLTGLIAGVIPAFLAARMDPVIAIRAK